MGGWELPRPRFVARTQGERHEVPATGIWAGGRHIRLGLHFLFEHDQIGATTAAACRSDSSASRLSGRYDHAHDDHDHHSPLAGNPSAAFLLMPARSAQFDIRANWPGRPQVAAQRAAANCAARLTGFWHGAQAFPASPRSFPSRSERLIAVARVAASRQWRRSALLRAAGSVGE